MTQPLFHSSLTRRIPVDAVALVGLFWGAAAMVAVFSHLGLDPYAPSAGAAVAFSGIAAAAYAYTRVSVRRRAIVDPLGVGVYWLLLAILTELALTEHLGHGWYALLGSPERPLLRTVALFVWVFAPPLFARRNASRPGDPDVL